MRTLNRIVTLTTLLCMPSMLSADPGHTDAGASDDNVRITKEYKLTGFNAIEYGYTGHIFYTQAPEYSVKVIATEEKIKEMKVEKKGELLKITRNNKDKNVNDSQSQSVEVYVTAPDLEMLKVTGMVNFKTERLETNSFNIKIMGVMNLDLDSLICHDTVNVNVSGVANLNMVAKAKKISYNCSGVGNGTITMVADELRLGASGVVNQNLKFEGDKAYVNCSGKGNIELHTDCQYLKATNRGMNKLTITGKAAKIDIKSDDASKINVKGLN